MNRKGVHHIGLATLDIDRTIEFYTTKLGFEIGWCDVLEPENGGKIKHVFFDTGDGTFMAFMSPEKVPGIPEEWSTDINSCSWRSRRQSRRPGRYTANCLRQSGPSCSDEA